MKVYVVTHWVDCEYDNIEKDFVKRLSLKTYKK